MTAVYAYGVDSLHCYLSYTIFPLVQSSEIWSRQFHASAVLETLSKHYITY